MGGLISESDLPPVLVFGSGLTALGALRVLSRRGISCFAVDGSQGVRWSRWYRRAADGAPVQPCGEHLAEWLRTLDLEQAVLLGCSDDWVRCLASRGDEARERFHTSLPDASTISTLIDKSGLASSLCAAGVPHPDTRVLETDDDLDAIPDRALSSAFLKPVDSQRFGSVFGRKAFTITSRIDAVAKLRLARQAGVALVLQEYIPGPATSHYFIDGFTDVEGVVRAVFARRRHRMYPPDFGNSSYMRSVDRCETEQATSDLQRLLQHVGYRGIFSAEFKRDERDGIFKLLEVNVRPWWYVEFAARAGVDVCYMYYLDALRRPVASISNYRVGERLVHTWSDFRAWTERRRAGDEAWWDHWSAWIGSHRPTFTWDDPLPALANAVRSGTRMAGSVLRRGA